MRRRAASRKVSYSKANCKHSHSRVRTAIPNAYMNPTTGVQLERAERQWWNAGAGPSRGCHTWLWAINARLTHMDPLLPTLLIFQEKV